MSSGGQFHIEDNTAQVLAEIDDAVDGGLKLAGLYAAAHIQKSMPKNPKVEAGQGGWKKSFGHLAKSAPGSPPMQQSGELKRAIISGKVGHLKYMVGTRRGYGQGKSEGKPYGFWLDQGTKKMGARPWLGAMFRARKKQIAAQFQKGFDLALKDD